MKAEGPLLLSAQFPDRMNLSPCVFLLSQLPLLIMNANANPSEEKAMITRVGAGGETRRRSAMISSGNVPSSPKQSSSRST
jgi:hypothetical protein